MSVWRALLSSARARRGSVPPLSSFPFQLFQNVEFAHTCVISSCAIRWTNTKRLYFSSTSTNSNHNQSIKGTNDTDLSLNSFKNLLACNPKFVSIDENGRRIFISDSYNNRIIITNIDGKILDCIGDSSQGFEDGEFEFSKLSYPTSSYYSQTTNSLYFIDSENNGVRRADLENRVVETIYPRCIKKHASIWKRILDKLGLGNENFDLSSQKIESEFSVSEIESPWHLIDINYDNLLSIIDKKFEISWIIDAENGTLKEIIKGRESTMELCENIIKERVSLLKNFYPTNNLNMENYHNALELVSSIASFNNHTFFCETDGKRILKYNSDSKSISSVRISNLGVLGLPNWIICPLEKVVTSNLMQKGKEHIHCVNVLPGKCEIRVFITVPIGTEMASALEENNIFRQIRGCASEISLSEEHEITNQEKVGVAQQWFDELDNLAFTQNEDENSNSNNEDLIISEKNIDNNNVYFDCALNISPGTCEVLISAALYLRIKRGHDNPETKSSIIRILESEISNEELRRISDDELFVRKCEDLVFVKPLRLRIKVECGDYPSSAKVNEIISTDSSLSLNISL